MPTAEPGQQTFTQDHWDRIFDGLAVAFPEVALEALYRGSYSTTFAADLRALLRQVVREDVVEEWEAGGPGELILDTAADPGELTVEASGLAHGRGGTARSIGRQRNTDPETRAEFPWEVVVDLGPAGPSTSLHRSAEEAAAAALGYRREVEGSPRLAAMARELAQDLAHMARTGCGGNTLKRRRILRAALNAYRSDRELEAAEALSRAQDYTDGGGPVDAAGRRLDR